MHIIDILLLVVKNEGENGLRGRTLLQKKVYFLSVLMKVDLGFSPHFYGPYSSYVAGHLDSLVNCGLLREVTESFSTSLEDKNIFGEIRRHTYFFPDDAEEMWQDLQKKTEFSKWEKTLERINSQKFSNDFDYLSIAAKVYYIVSRKKEITLRAVRQVAEGYGWNVSKVAIENALSFLTELNLVKVD